MTEISPVGTYNARETRAGWADGQAAVQHMLKQGRVLFGIDMRSSMAADANCHGTASSSAT